MSKAKPRGLKLRCNAYLTEMDLRRIYYFRFGSERPKARPVRTYKEVGRLCHLPPSTCFYAIRRYINDGHKFVDRRRNNLAKCWPDKVKLKGEIAEYLLNPNVLTAWAGYSLARRCYELKQLGVSVIPDTLSKFYKRNKVRFVVCKYQY